MKQKETSYLYLKDNQLPIDLTINSLEDAVLHKLSSSDKKKYLIEISEKFTVNRSKIQDYTLDPKHVSAYTYFYLPTNIPKYSFIMNQLSQKIAEGIGKTHFIDFGSGPGTFSLAHLDYYGDDKSLSLVDISKVMLKQAKSCINHYFPENKKAKFYTSYLDLPLSEQKAKTLFFGHCLNEVGSGFACRVIDYIKPEYIIFITPGTPFVFKQLMEVRKYLYEVGFETLYPCPSKKLSCPIEDSDDWCHQILKMNHSHCVERLSQMIGKDRRTMPLIAHVYKMSNYGNEKNETVDIKTCYRVTRFFKETKFSFLLEICYFDGQNNSHQKIEILKKGLSKAQIKSLKNINIGLSINFKLEKKMNDGLWRVRLNDVENSSLQW